MTIHIRNVEWSDHNSQRAYPLTIEATKQDASGSFTLPDSFIISIKLGIHSGISVDPARFFVRQVGNYASGFGIEIGYDDGSSEGVAVATTNIARASYEPLATYRLVGIGDFIDATGHIVLGKLDDIDLQPAGAFQFEAAGGLLEPDAVYPIVRGIASLRVNNGGDLSRALYEHITLVAGSNIRLTVTDGGSDTPSIYIDAISGEGLIEECVCADDESPPIRRINGIPGTFNGDFELLGNDCVAFEPIENGLKLDDTCSTPCCGCKELEVVTAALEVLHTQAATMDKFLADLTARVSQMDLSVLGSRLGDRGCNEC